jgi:hypothetical protein
MCSSEGNKSYTTHVIVHSALMILKLCKSSNVTNTKYIQSVMLTVIKGTTIKQSWEDYKVHVLMFSFYNQNKK